MQEVFSTSLTCAMGRTFRRNGSTFTLFCIKRHRGYASGQIDITELVFISLLLYLSFLQLNVNWCGDATVNRGGPLVVAFPERDK
jgi:hypothetical protein